MDTKIFLQGFDSKVSSNTSEGLNVQFKGRIKLLPLNDVAEVISQYDQYREEREKCNIIRLTCQVNPICSNVLFNKITEIVKHEGYSGVSFINYAVYGTDELGNDYSGNEDKLFSGVTYKPNTSGAMDFWRGNRLEYLGHTSHNYDSNNTISSQTEADSYNYEPDYVLDNSSIDHPTNAIRDTQLSNVTTNFVYHCGLDIFNNHLIRSNTFKTVCKMPDNFNPTSYTEDYKGFNTITDLMRDVRGNKVIEKVCFPVTAPVENHSRLIALHLYDFYDIGFLFISEIIIVAVVVSFIRRIGPAMFINIDFELFLYIRSIVSYHFLYTVLAVWYVIDNHIAISPYNKVFVVIAGPGCITDASVH